MVHVQIVDKLRKTFSDKITELLFFCYTDCALVPGFMLAILLVHMPKTKWYLRY